MAGVLGFNTNYDQPQMSAEEQEILNALQEDMEAYREWQQQMLPYEMEDMGLTWEWNEEYLDEEGNVIEGFESKIDNPEAIAQKQEYERQIAELRGKIAIAEGTNNTGQIQTYQGQINKLQKKINELNLTTTESVKPEIGNTEYGYWRKMSDDEYYASLSDVEKMEYDVRKAQAERTQQALEGKLPISQELQEQKRKEFENLKQVYQIEGDTLENAVGQDTIAVQNLNDYKKRWAQIEDSIRFGQAGSNVESVILGQGLTTGLTQNKIGTMANIGAQQGSTIPMYGSILQPHQMYNMAGYQAQAANMANQSSQFASLLGLIGMLGGGYLASSRKYKKNIKAKTAREENKALADLRKTKSYEYEYKLMPGKRLGGVTEESPQEYVTLGGNAIDLPAKIEYIAMGLKALDRKVRKIA